MLCRGLLAEDLCDGGVEGAAHRRGGGGLGRFLLGVEFVFEVVVLIVLKGHVFLFIAEGLQIGQAGRCGGFRVLIRAALLHPHHVVGEIILFGLWRIVGVMLEPRLPAVGTLHITPRRRHHIVGDFVLRVAVGADQPHGHSWVRSVL